MPGVVLPTASNTGTN